MQRVTLISFILNMCMKITILFISHRTTVFILKTLSGIGMRACTWQKISKIFLQVIENLPNYPDSRTENDFAFGKAVVYRDSYFVSMKPYFAENFRDVTYFWRQDVRKSDVECLKNSDIVVYEVVERYVPSMVGLRFPKELEEY